MKIQYGPLVDIFERKSIRHYQPQLIEDELLLKFQEYSQNVLKLDESNKFFLDTYTYSAHNKYSKALGNFGWIMSPPHFFVPYIVGNFFALTDLGFRVQQMVLEMWRQRVGSCYIGCVHRQQKVKKILGLPQEACLSAFVVFGKPDINSPERLYRKISQIFTRSHRRISLRDLFLDSSWRDLGDPKNFVYQVVEAGRFAPSAVNAQPWKFRIENGDMAVFAKINQVKKLYDLYQDYPLHDVGLCMANMSMAAGGMGYELKWRLAHKPVEEKINGQRVIRIAAFSMKGLGGNNDKH